MKQSALVKTRTLTLMLIAISYCWSLSNAVAEVTVHHFAQNHGSFQEVILKLLDYKRAGTPLPADFDLDVFLNKFSATYASQDKVYRSTKSKLEADPEILVYNENFFANPTAEECGLIREKFSNFSIETPDFEQILMLVQHTPPHILYCQGKLKNLKPGEDPDLNAKARKAAENAYNPYGGEAGDAIFTARETWLANQIKNDLAIPDKNHREHDVIIVFGAAHDFEPYFVPGPNQIVTHVKFKRENQLSAEETSLLENQKLKLLSVHVGLTLYRGLKPKFPPMGDLGRKLLQTELTKVFLELSSTQKDLNEKALLPEYKLRETQFKQAVFAYPQGRLPIAELARYEDLANLTNLTKDPKDLNAFMAAMVPTYDPSSYWDPATTSIEPKQ